MPATAGLLCTQYWGHGIGPVFSCTPTLGARRPGPVFSRMLSAHCVRSLASLVIRCGRKQDQAFAYSSREKTAAGQRSRLAVRKSPAVAGTRGIRGGGGGCPRHPTTRKGRGLTVTLAGIQKVYILLAAFGCQQAFCKRMPKECAPAILQGVHSLDRVLQNACWRKAATRRMCTFAAPSEK